MGLGQRSFFKANFCHLPTLKQIKSSVTHTKDFFEKNVPNLPDFKEKSDEIAIFIQ
jgi:hypothetical protein